MLRGLAILLALEGIFSGPALCAKPSRRANRAATGSFHHDGVNDAWGTGFLVGTYGDRASRRGLVLTVRHNLPRDLKSAYLKFGSRRARVVSNVASSRELDYALLEVRLSQRLWDGKPRPVELGAAPAAAQGVYAIGFPEGTGVPRQTLRLGRESDEGRRSVIAIEGSSGKSVTSYAFDYAPGVGLSGGPVVARETGRVVGIHYGGGQLANQPGRTHSFAVATADALADAGQKVARAGLDAETRQAAYALTRTNDSPARSTRPSPSSLRR